jgi:hypothetical protein
MGSTYFLNVVPNPSFVPPTQDAPVSIIRVGELPMSATEGRPHVDVELDPLTWGRAAVVDDQGGVWLWWEGKERIEGRYQSHMRL